VFIERIVKRASGYDILFQSKLAILFLNFANAPKHNVVVTWYQWSVFNTRYCAQSCYSLATHGIKVSRFWYSCRASKLGVSLYIFSYINGFRVSMFSD